MNCSLAQLRSIQKTLPLIDVRSPSEYHKGHIPGAINLPLFTDEERAKVGTLYKRRGQRSAVTLGLKLVGPKLADFTRQAYELASDNQLVLYCWRGGMRSNSMAWLFRTAGLRVEVLEGGYKAFRQAVSELFESHGKLRVLGGPTGSQKTLVLHELRKLGEQVIDLEGIARHKGSAFGNPEEVQQPSTEHFANLVSMEWADFDPEREVWIEDESRTIGSVWLPEKLYKRIRNGQIIVAEKPIEERARFLASDYGSADPETLKDGFRKISKRLGGQHVIAAVEAIEQGDYVTAAGIGLRYYDKTYSYGLDRREQTRIHRFDASNLSPKAIALALLKKKKTI